MDIRPTRDFRHSAWRPYGYHYVGKEMAGNQWRSQIRRMGIGGINMSEQYKIKVKVVYHDESVGTINVELNETGKHAIGNNIKIHNNTGHLDLMETIDRARRWLSLNNAKSIEIEED